MLNIETLSDLNKALSAEVFQSKDLSLSIWTCKTFYIKIRPFALSF